MSRASESEKLALELEAASVFLDWYATSYDVQCRLIKPNQPAKPDVTCQIGNDKVDIEIAHLYGSEKEAMKILGRTLTDSTRYELQQLMLEGDTQQRLCAALKRILKQKAEKHYHSEKVWLVVRNVHPDWRPVELLSQQAFIDIPEDHPFECIWLIGDRSATSGVIRLA
ncbi:hypothetical protein [Alteromonas facilis]|uniref:hypothetical protein n=1 Tax=Alteromonas facilis TaxID=2048004 RepID=UPI000C28FB5C|nr:hypothetical protein [Alteromonas facilis]